MEKRTLNAHKKENGAALVTAIFAILLVTLIGTALHYMASISLTVAVNERDNTEAFYIAEAGVEHAFELISKVEKSKYSLILKAGANPQPNTGDELSVPPASGLWVSSESIPPGNQSGGGITNFGSGGFGRYWVSIKNDTATGETPIVDLNGVLIITSTGVGRNGATAIIETTVKGLATPPAVLINGKANISGSVRIQGANAILHANDTLSVNGNPCADLYFSTSANIINPNKAKGSGCSGSAVIRTNQPIIDPPIYNIRNDFYGKTDYILGAIGTKAGKVYNGSGVLIVDTTQNGNKWISGTAQWIWSPVQKVWIQSGTSILNASFYSEGNIAITGNFGTALAPARVSFIAEGCIYNQGKQYMAPKYQNFSLVAGTDLKISGKLTEVSLDDLMVDGITYALHQIDFSGTPTIRGTVIAANQADTNSPGGFNLVPLDSGYMKISGNPTIIADDVKSGGVTNLNWREVRR
jgi:hypothetical protein